MLFDFILSKIESFQNQVFISSLCAEKIFQSESKIQANYTMTDRTLDLNLAEWVKPAHFICLYMKLDNFHSIESMSIFRNIHRKTNCECYH